MTETQEWQLEAAQDVLATWENILQDQVRAARATGDTETATARQQDLYAVARERKKLAGATPEAVQAASASVAKLIADYRESAVSDE